LNIRLLKKRRDPPPHPILRLSRIVIGILVLAIGIVTAIPLIPGQGLLTILAGLWILSLDIRLARRVLLKVRILGRRTKRRYKTWRGRSGGAH
jgi:small-conductance mechanosensitive channel